MWRLAVKQRIFINNKSDAPNFKCNFEALKRTDLQWWLVNFVHIQQLKKIND